MLSGCSLKALQRIMWAVAGQKKLVTIRARKDSDWTGDILYIFIYIFVYNVLHMRGVWKGGC